jgi:SAM-dependent methyltransferase
MQDKPLAYEAYEKLADAYAEKAEHQPFNAYLERPTTRALIPDVYGKQVIEAGCGPGHNTKWLLERGAHVSAFDISPKMIAHAKNLVGNSADLRIHDIEKPLDWIENNSVDVVLASLVLDYVEDWLPILKDFKRVLKSEGCLVLSCGHPAYDFIVKPGDGDYFRVQRVDLMWRSWGEPVLVPSFKRPLGNITGALEDAGFLIESLVEARPTEDFKHVDPEGYEKISKRPSFLNIRAVPK